MMINKRLIATVSESKKYIVGNVVLQWISLLANIVMMITITGFLAGLYYRKMDENDVTTTLLIIVAVVIVRFLCAIGSTKMSYLSSKTVKKVLREMIYKKLLKLGTSYKEKVQTSEIVQVAVEGVDQLETYFGAYLPQFFYAMLAPLTLFFVLSFVNIPSAIVLFLCVPMIPITIAMIQRWAKKLLAKYWGQYTALGDTFLENLQGLTTLKIYQSDEFKNKEMNEQSEHFRKITMKVLTMQLNSITIMDLIAYGGAAIGVILSVTQYKSGKIELAEALIIIMLSADFFIPMRQLGSFFHVAMNGMAASDKIFRLLDLPDNKNEGKQMMPLNSDIVCRNLSFSYDKDNNYEEKEYYKKNESQENKDIENKKVCQEKTNKDIKHKEKIVQQTKREVLKGITMTFPKGSFTAIVGESGCGKSTIASILMGRNKNYRGSIQVGGVELSEIAEDSLLENVTYISHQSFLFKGTVRENLLMGNPSASDEALWSVLQTVKLAEFLKSENGLDTQLTEKAGNLSGGQCQRLALARALLHNTQVYIFDEATSNIDVESENDIIEQIYQLAKEKTVILISHRLANVVGANQIYVLDKGTIKECGSHEALLKEQGVYANLWNTQMRLENYSGITQEYI